MAKIEKGNDLMLFLGSGTTSAATKSIAFATNHTLTINANTISTSHKDLANSGVTWESETVQSMNWEAGTDNLYSLNGEGGSYDDLFGYMVAGTELQAVFGSLSTHPAVPTGGYSAPTTGYKGKVIITNLVLNAPNGDNATYTATFRGVGALVKF